MVGLCPYKEGEMGEEEKEWRREMNDRREKGAGRRKE